MLKGGDMMPLEQMMTLKALRVRKGLTQNDVANIVGVNRMTIIKWEKDAGNMPIKYMSQFSELYKYPMNAIFFGSVISFRDKLNVEEGRK